VGEAEGETGDQSGFGEGEHDAAKSLQGRMAERCGGTEQGGVDGPEGGGERLDGEGKTV